MIVPAIIYLLGAILVIAFRNKPSIRKYLVLVISALGAANVALLKAGMDLSVKLVGFNLVLIHADKLSLFVAYIFTFIAFLGFLYSFYIDDFNVQVFALIYVAGALGVVFAGDFITVYIFWEIMAIASTALVWANKNKESYDAGIRYIIMHLAGGALLLGGIVLHYMDSGSIAVAPVKTGLAGILIMLGVGLNAAFILFHTWLPDSYPRAPFYASVFMAVFTTKTAVYMLVRTSSGLTVLAYIGAFMTVYSVIFALMQTNVRKFLSYSIITQVGFMVAAVGMGGDIGINGAVMHIFNHILYKSLFFMAIGAVIYMTGEEDLRKMGGLLKKMPVTTTCIIIAALSTCGFPLFCGFTSKALIFEATEVVKGRLAIEIMLELAAVGTILAFIKVVYFGFIRPNPEFSEKAKEAPIMMLVPMVIVAFSCVLVGVYPWFVARLLPYHVEEGFYNFARVAGSFQLIIPILICFILLYKVFEPRKQKQEIMEFDRLYQNAGRLIPYFSATGQYIENTLNYSYEGLTNIPRLVSSVMVPINSNYERALDSTVKSTSKLKKPLSQLNNLVSKLFIGVFIDSWLYNPSSSIDPSTSKKREFTNIIAQLTKFVEKYIIDGFVNGVVAVVLFFGNRARRVQTGLVQNYALIIFFIVSSFILFLSLVVIR